MTKPLTIERLAGLVRTRAVHRVFLQPYPGGGWFIDVDHGDPVLTRELHSQRGGLRVFKSADAAIRALKECGYDKLVSVAMTEQA